MSCTHLKHCLYLLKPFPERFPEPFPEPLPKPLPKPIPKPLPKPVPKPFLEPFPDHIMLWSKVGVRNRVNY